MFFALKYKQRAREKIAQLFEEQQQAEKQQVVVGKLQMEWKGRERQILQLCFFAGQASISLLSAFDLLQQSHLARLHLPFNFHVVYVFVFVVNRVKNIERTFLFFFF